MILHAPRGDDRRIMNAIFYVLRTGTLIDSAIVKTHRAAKRRKTSNGINRGGRFHENPRHCQPQRPHAKLHGNKRASSTTVRSLVT